MLLKPDRQRYVIIQFCVLLMFIFINFARKQFLKKRLYIKAHLMFGAFWRPYPAWLWACVCHWLLSQTSADDRAHSPHNKKIYAPSSEVSCGMVCTSAHRSSVCNYIMMPDQLSQCAPFSTPLPSTYPCRHCSSKSEKLAGHWLSHWATMGNATACYTCVWLDDASS